MQRFWKQFAVLWAVALIFAGANEAGFATGSPARAETILHTSRDLFLEKCSRCHEEERAYDIISHRLNWMRTVASMAVKNRSWMPPEAVEDILHYRTYYPIHMRALFQHRCGECHGLDELRRRPRSAGQWQTLITYMSKRWGLDVTDEERALLVAGLRA